MPDGRPLSRQAQRDPAGVSALHALLERLIDHAALFPPASLSMDAALAADRAARAGEHAWMLGRFICPASRLGELPSGVPGLSVVLDGGAADLGAVLGSGLPVELVEARLSPDLLEADLGAVRAFWEVAPGSDVRGLPCRVEAIRPNGRKQANRRGRQGRRLSPKPKATANSAWWIGQRSLLRTRVVPFDLAGGSDANRIASAYLRRAHFKLLKCQFSSFFRR